MSAKEFVQKALHLLWESEKAQIEKLLDESEPLYARILLFLVEEKGVASVLGKISFSLSVAYLAKKVFRLDQQKAKKVFQDCMRAFEKLKIEYKLEDLESEIKSLKKKPGRWTSSLN